jgi:hypothetical protein
VDWSRRHAGGRRRDPNLAALFRALWFRSVEPVADFWVERNGKPVRRIQLYRCREQRLAFPFAMDHRAERLARTPVKRDGGPMRLAR